MNNKKNLLVIPAVLFALNAYAVDPAKGTITIDGEILTNTCTVQVGSGSGKDSGFDTNISLRGVGQSAFTESNQIVMGGTTNNDISIQLSNCENAVSSILVTANGASSSKLGVLPTNSTTNVDFIVAKDSAGATPIDLSATQPQFTYTDTDATSFTAEMYVGYIGPATASSVKPGNLTGILDYTVAYN